MTNEGTLTDAVIEDGGSVTGGTLDGDTVNNGLVSNVTLTAGASIEGGTVAGNITGNASDPALVNSSIEAGAVLENIIIGPDAIVDPSVTIGPNVTFQALSTIPPGLDLSGALEMVPWGSDSGVHGLNLARSVISGTGPDDPITLLQSLAMLDETADGLIVDQNTQTGELILQAGDVHARVLPVHVSQAPADAEPGITFDANGDVVFITETGQEITGYPVLENVQSLESSLQTQGLALNFDERANLRISEPGAGTENGVIYTARPDVVAVPAHRSMTPGLHLYQLESPPGVQGASLIYENADGDLLEQTLVPVASDWLALKAALEDMPDAAEVAIDTLGVITVDINGMAVQGRMDYAVTRPADPESDAPAVAFEEMGDLNGDGTGDYTITYPNGDQQTLYVLP